MAMISASTAQPTGVSGGNIGSNNQVPVIYRHCDQHQHNVTNRQRYVRNILPLLAGVALSLTFSQYYLASLDHSQHQNAKLQQWKSLKDEFSSSSKVPMNQGKKQSSSSLQSQSNPPYHIVFSTSCHEQQNWESWVFFYHCYRVQQPGNITRIVSGCKPEEEEELKAFHNKYVVPSFGTNYHIHFTPDYSKIVKSEGKYPYKYMNKPYGLRHWFEHGPLQLKNYDTEKSMESIPSAILDGIVFLLDPDMILLRPLTHDFTNEEVIFVQQSTPDEIRTKVVKHGYPMAQQDGYLSNEWMYFNFSIIFDGISTHFVPSPKSKSQDGPVYWNTGPPYIATVKDMYTISKLWCTLTPQVFKVYPELFAEMFGFIISTLQLNLPFTMIKSIVISTTSTPDREGWSYIDNLPDTNDICTIAKQFVTQTTLPAGVGQTKLPIGLHYCERYILGQNFFSKYRVKKNIMSCHKNLLKPMDTLDGLYPANDYNQKIPPRADLKDVATWKEVSGISMSASMAKREAFMLCGLTHALNEALRFYKRNTAACIDNGQQPNFNESYTVYDDPTDY